MKKGIALFSTLMILVLVVMLMSVALKNSTNITQSVLKDRYLIQENLTVTDAIKLFEKQIATKLVKVKGEKRVEFQKVLFTTPLQIQDSVTNSLVEITMIPNDGKLNINYIHGKEGEKMIKKLFENLEVNEPNILTEIILANITNNDKYRDEYKLPLKQLDTSFGYINSYDEFLEMLDIYVQNSDDSEVYDVDFKKYFHFYNEAGIKYNRMGGTLDINYIEPELIDSVTNVSIKNSIRKRIQEKNKLFYTWSELELDNAAKEKEILKDHSFDLVTNNIILKINTTSINNKIEYKLNYNLTTKKISKISMDRWIY